MSAPGRTVRIFLVDGDPGGIATAEIVNWSGHVLVAPRLRLPEALKRAEARRSGVYILAGDIDEETGLRRIYIGESENVADRLRSHLRDEGKDFFERVCIVTSKDLNLTKAHIRYLEAKLVQLAGAAGHVGLENGTGPEGGPLPESDQSDMEYFLDQLRLLLPVLQLDILADRRSRGALRQVAGAAPGEGVEPAFRPEARPVPEAEVEAEAEPGLVPDAVVLTLSHRKRSLADAIYEDGTLTVRAGARARRETAEAGYNYARMRAQLIARGDLIADPGGGDLRFIRDVDFPSPSAASAVILGRNDNGRMSWRLADTNETLKDYESRMIEALT